MSNTNDCPQPRGLSALDATGLAELREIVLGVIDAGDVTPKDYDVCGKPNCGVLRWYHNDARTATKTHQFVEPKRGREWLFAGQVETQRRFANAIESAIIAKTCPKAVKE